MGNLILNFLQEQGILIVMGLMVLEGIVHQWVASRRYRRLRTGLQALAASGSGTAERGQTEILRQGGQVTYGKRTETAAESMAESRNDIGLQPGWCQFFVCKSGGCRSIDGFCIHQLHDHYQKLTSGDGCVWRETEITANL